MAFSVNTNVGALVALQNLNSASKQLNDVQTKISTGLEVASVKDSASTFLIAQNQRADLAGLNAVQDSLNRAQSTIDVAVNAGESISDLLTEAREIAVAASDTGLDANSRTALNNDFQAIVSQVDSIISGAEFNGTNLLKDSPDNVSAISGVNSDGTTNTLNINGLDITTDSAAATTANAILFKQTISSLADLNGEDAVQASYLINNEATSTAVVDDGDGTASFDFTNAVFTDPNTTPGDGDETLTVTIDGNDFIASGTFSSAADGANLSASDFKLASPTEVTINANDVSATQDIQNESLSNVDLTNDFFRAAAVGMVDNFQDAVNNKLADLGAKSRQVGLQADFTQQLSDTIEVGIGNLVDADLAKESANLQALQVKQQLGLQSLAIANQAPGSVLSLFR